MSFSTIEGSPYIDLGQFAKVESPVDERPMLKRVEKAIEGVDDRIDLFWESLSGVKVLKLVSECDDSRVGYPSVVDDKGVLIRGLNIIGGGKPSEKYLSLILKTYWDHLMPKTTDISVFATSHGSTEEINRYFNNEPNSEITCGLRDFLAKFERFTKKMAELRKQGKYHQLERFAALTSMIAGVSGDNIPASFFSQAWGTNHSHDMGENAANIKKALESKKFVNGVGKPIMFGEAALDHNKKILYEYDENKLITNTIKLDIPEYYEKDQDPEFVVISYGSLVPTVPKKTLVPDLLEKGNNGFSAIAIDREGLRHAYAEGWYAINSHLLHKKGHGHGQSFKNLKGVIILCDNNDRVQEAMAEFKNGDPKATNVYREFGGVYLVDVEKKEVTFHDLNFELAA